MPEAHTADPADAADLEERFAGLGDRLSSLEDLPVSEHVEVFDAVHRSLQDALATLDEA